MDKSMEAFRSVEFSRNVRHQKGLDETDLKILTELRKNGRISNVDLSKKIGLSPTPCLERVRSLENAGYISGYTALLNYSLLGRSVLFTVMIKFDKSVAGVMDSFRKFVSADSRIFECLFITGCFDCILKVRVGDVNEYGNFVQNELMKQPGIAEIQSCVVLDSIEG
ncbi:winged helix-turn-helix transcriptional regulator [Ruminobacter sp.]|jgi:Lrp/AsnC family leucine-responsive transcriptional regulator|uniref:winged helix-turn-helix transcriptional regulator n=1 Tax=Ruminobacter sp. TaxID=2774296 RepID=UPI00386D530D